MNTQCLLQDSLLQDKAHGLHSKRHRRDASTLLELVATLLSATVLLAGLAATVAVTVSLLDVPPTQSTDALAQEIHDRMQMDLRYATTLTTPNSSTISLQRTGPVTSLPEQVTYTFGTTGLRRQVGSNAIASLDTAPAGIVASLDSYSIPLPVPTKTTCLRSVSKVASSGSATSISVDMPPDCVSGDLLLLGVSGDFASSSVNVPGGWSTIRDVSRTPLRQVVLYRYCGINDTLPVNITSPTSSPMAAVLLSIGKAHPSNPVSYSSTATGYSIVIASTPSVLQPASSNPARMLVQFVAAEGDQWPGSTFNLASYVDVGHAVASPSSNSLSLGVAMRHGIYPGLTTTPRVRFAGLGRWVQTAVEIEVSP